MNRNFKPLLLLAILMLGLFAFTSDKGKKKKTKARKSIIKKTVQKTPAITDTAENHYYIIVDKSDYELKVYDDEGWYATYPVVFGTKDLRDKMYQGDKRTPDGKFRIVEKKIHSKWGPFMLLDYPNDESYERYKERKSKGLIPEKSAIGGGIAIHATRKEEEWTVDHFYNWTDGCVSVKYTEMEDLYSFIPIGTEVTIQQ